MSETIRDSDPKPVDSELTQSQKELKEFAEDMLSFRPNDYIANWWGYESYLAPEDIQRRLRETSFGDLLLKDGDSLSAPNPSPLWGELGLFVGQAMMSAVGVTAWGYEKYRIDHDRPRGSEESIIDYPGEKDWTRRINIWLAYTNDVHTATQSLAVSTTSQQPGKTPSVSRDVRSQSYAEMGYDGHNEVGRDDFAEQDIITFLAIAQDLFDTKIEK